MPNKTIPFKFSLLPGDLINALPGMKEVCTRMNRTAEIYLGLDIAWAMSDEVSQGRESNVTLTQKSMDMLKPLLLSQPWITKVESLQEAYPEKYEAWCEAFKNCADFVYAAKWYKDHPDAMIDLDRHHLTPMSLQYSNIFRWNFYVYADMTCDLSKRWLDIPVNDHMPPETIIINRTERCQNPTISYSFLKKYEDRLLFAGHRHEWATFCTKFDLKIPLLTVNNFLELAIAIRSCSFFIGNQSLCFSLAEAMKVPRILEVCSYLPNVIPCGEKAYDFFFQSNLQMFVEDLANPMNGYKNDPYSQYE